MSTSIINKDFTIETSTQFESNMNHLIKTNFGIDPNQLNKFLLKYKAMIAGGSVSRCDGIVTEEELNAYEGDLDIWIPLTQATSVDEFKELFLTSQSHYKAENDFMYNVANNYKQELMGNVELYEIGRSLAMYKDHIISIKKLEIARDRVKDIPVIYKQINDAIEELKSQDEQLKAKRITRLDFNNENLKVLFSKECNITQKIISSEYIREDPLYNIRDQLRDLIEKDTDEEIEDEIIGKDEIVFGLSSVFPKIVYANNGSPQSPQSPQSPIGSPQSPSNKPKTQFDYLNTNSKLEKQIKKQIESIKKNLSKYDIPKDIKDYSYINIKYFRKLQEERNKLEEDLMRNTLILQELEVKKNDLYYRERLGFDKVFTISRFKCEVNGKIKEIQLIFTFISHHMMMQLFDLSFCAVGWDGLNVHSFEPKFNKYKIGYRMNYRAEKREIARQAKYESRGFKIFETEEECEAYYCTLKLDA